MRQRDTSPARQENRIRIPLPADSSGVRNLYAARRRMENATRKLYESQLLLADVPEGLERQAQEAQVFLRQAVKAALAADRLLYVRKAEDSPEQAPEIEMPKRPRGRPRKNPIPEGEESGVSALA